MRLSYTDNESVPMFKEEIKVLIWISLKKKILICHVNTAVNF